MPSESTSSSYHSKDTTLTKIFVGGLPYHTTDVSLRNFFEQFGEIEEAVVITDRQTGKSRGYGFVTMTKKSDALQAIRDPNPCIDGRKANVNLAVLGAKPRIVAGMANASSLLAMANGDSTLLNPLLQQTMTTPALLGQGQMNPALLSSLLAMGAGSMPLLPPATGSRMMPQAGQLPLSELQGNPYVNAASMGVNPYLLAQMLYANTQNPHHLQQQQPFVNPYLPHALDALQFGQGMPTYATSMVMPLGGTATNAAAAASASNNAQQQLGAASLMGLNPLYTGVSESSTGGNSGGVGAAEGNGAACYHPQVVSGDIYGQLVSAVSGPPSKGLNNGAMSWQQQQQAGLPVFQVPNANNGSVPTSLNGALSSVMSGQKNDGGPAVGTATTPAAAAANTSLLSSSPIRAMTSQIYEQMQAGRTGEATTELSTGSGLRSFM
ncbi:hypothetical protein AAHC03_05536 [Spirometra sp. Aus1]